MNVSIRLCYPNELYHHGILGQKWGVRRFQNPDGTLTVAGIARYGRKNLYKAKTANIDKWGKDPNNNVLYIAGYSGSGKSTTAQALVKKNDTKIHLDAYSGLGNNMLTDKKFNAFLDKKVPNWKDMKNAHPDGKGVNKKFSNEYWKTVDAFRDAIEDYGKQEYKKGNKVVVEGIQIPNDWLTGNKQYYKGKSLVILSTNPATSLNRARMRDERRFKNIDDVKAVVKVSASMSKNLKDLAKETDAGRLYLLKHKSLMKELIP